MSLDEMKDHLNDLWTQYLDFLDQYDKAQKELSKHLSSGFFSLAQANFKPANRIRYGQDYYDERMQASRLASISIDDGGRTKVSIARAEIQSEDVRKEDLDHVEVKQQPTPPGTPPADNGTTDEDDGAEEVETKKAAQAEQVVKDPIRWFGVLVPSQLRSCQSSFVAAVEGPVCVATNAAREMRAIEVGIRKLRKDIKKAEKGAKGVSIAL
ncbi:hypothetical protein MBLNU457_g2864t1 [Dothideomycetes sp. NU457]